jgi:hypothetical protein
MAFGFSCIAQFVVIGSLKLGNFWNLCSHFFTSSSKVANGDSLPESMLDEDRIEEREYSSATFLGS